MKRAIACALMVLALAATGCETDDRMTDYEACKAFSKGAALGMAECNGMQLVSDDEFDILMEATCGPCDDSNAWYAEADYNACIDGLVWEYDASDDGCHVTHEPPECNRMLIALDACMNLL